MAAWLATLAVTFLLSRRAEVAGGRLPVLSFP